MSRNQNQIRPKEENQKLNSEEDFVFQNQKFFKRDQVVRDFTQQSNKKNFQKMNGFSFCMVKNFNKQKRKNRKGSITKNFEIEVKIIRHR